MIKKLLSKLGITLTRPPKRSKVAEIKMEYIIDGGNSYVNVETSWGPHGSIYVPSLFLAIANGAMDEKIITSIEQHNTEQSAYIISVIASLAARANAEFIEDYDDTIKPSKAFGIG